MNVKTLAIDLAKRVFFLHGEDEVGHVALREKVLRARLVERVAQLPPCTVVMEACGGAHYWSRRFADHGHTVRLINPKFVKPFVKSNKNDWNDAAAICGAAQRPTMRFVAPKSIYQQECLALHRIRQRLVMQRTAVVNQARGLLQEHGVVIANGLGCVRRELPRILEDATNELTPRMRALLAALRAELRTFDERIEPIDAAIARTARDEPRARRLLEVPGIGPLTATALVATIGDATLFRNGRQLATFIGLVPRQCSSGGKSQLGTISKRGDTYLRTLLIHGGRAVVRCAARKSDARSRWVQQLIARRGKYRAMVAVANKNARVAWALLSHEQPYRQAA